jgi:hypothetical protein
MVAPVLVAAGILMITFSLYNSIVNVRGYDDPVEAFVQRSLVQPAELWWLTWDSTVRSGSIEGSLAWSLMFDEPIDATRNTGIQFLMVKALGVERTSDLLFIGEQFAGGYPEVIFELFGPLLSWPILVLYGCVTAMLLRINVWAVATQRLLTAIFSLWVFFGFSLLYIGGMLNFIIAWTFWVKIAGLCAALILESTPVRRLLFQSRSMQEIPG